MPVVLYDDMSEREILKHVANTYADPSNWEPYEKDMGHGVFMVEPWSARDKGAYARRAVEMVGSKRGRLEAIIVYTGLILWAISVIGIVLTEAP